jgi:hypothetical protein
VHFHEVHVAFHHSARRNHIRGVLFKISDCDQVIPSFAALKDLARQEVLDESREMVGSAFRSADFVERTCAPVSHQSMNRGTHRVGSVLQRSAARVHGSQRAGDLGNVGSRKLVAPDLDYVDEDFACAISPMASKKREICEEKAHRRQHVQRQERDADYYRHWRSWTL